MSYHSAQDVLTRLYGYPSFRGQQEAIVETLASGHNALVIMPTGAGKSLCYQLPSLLREGVGVIVSPLIALMQDQVNAMLQLGVRAAYLNSSLSAEAQWQVEQALQEGELDLLYVAPERLVQDRMLNTLDRSTIALFAIDEAHCVSQWGHDFRADYLQLSLLADRYPAVPRIALTATADQRTQREISGRLQLDQAQHFVGGFDRPNIRYAITAKTNPKKQLLSFLANRRDEAGIVYCLSRKKVEDIAAYLCEQGFHALPYHAGLSSQLRETHQNRFLREEGIIIVATIAFGMGIDKPDVRFVAHLDLPKSIEAYYQETGRAGRDGESAEAWMVYGLQDVVRLQQMLGQSEGTEQYKRVERHKLDAMLGLCEVISCRREVLLDYFDGHNKSSALQCGNCDNCQIPPETWEATQQVQMLLSCVYRTGQRFGTGHIIDVLLGRENDKVLQHEHQQLSTFGIGKKLSEPQWRSLIRQLVVKGLLSVDVEGFSALHLTESCREILRGEQSVWLRKDDAQLSDTKKTRQKAAVLPEQEALWEALRDCRKSLADENNVPPYVIFHDKTLREMLEQRPMSTMQMLAISGVGSGKLEKYGSQFMDVIAQHTETIHS